MDLSGSLFWTIDGILRIADPPNLRFDDMCYAATESFQPDLDTLLASHCLTVLLSSLHIHCDTLLQTEQ